MSNDITKMLIEGKTDEVHKVQKLLEVLNLQSIRVYYNYVENIINVETIANNLAKYYGKYVRYKAPNGCNVKWCIFGTYEGKICLIADDYVSREYIPCGREGSKIYVNGKNNYRLSFDDVIDDYEGSMDIDRNLRFLNSKYFDELKGNKCNNLNIKAVAYILDTCAWKGFAGGKAESAIGGPSLELVLDSYNKLYPTQQIECCVTDIGYMIRRNGNINWSGSLSNAFDACNDKVSYIEDKSKTWGMWLASPSDVCRNDLNILSISYEAGLDSHWIFGHFFGFRPLVFLKPDTTLKLVEDDEYEIL